MIVFVIFIFFSFLIILYLLKRAKLHNEETDSISISSKEEEFEGNNSEFETNDWDKDVDEMPDDCLIYEDLFDEE